MENSHLENIKQEISRELADPKAINVLLATTFKDFTPELMHRALFEMMTRGFTFKDVLERNVYAVKYGSGYSLITSIDFARKIGQKNKVVDVEKPIYEEREGQVISCSVTVKKKTDEYVGSFTATVYFDEYNTKRNLWLSKPRTMIAKVAEMHALRKACPEDLSKLYTEEEFEKSQPLEVGTEEFETKLKAAPTLEALRVTYANIPEPAKTKLRPLAEELKTKIQQA